MIVRHLWVVIGDVGAGRANPRHDEVAVGQRHGVDVEIFLLDVQPAGLAVAARAEELLQLMEPEGAEDVRRLMSYVEDTAGGMMTSEPVILGPDATIADALAHVRNPELPPADTGFWSWPGAPTTTNTGMRSRWCMPSAPTPRWPGRR